MKTKLFLALCLIIISGMSLSCSDKTNILDTPELPNPSDAILQESIPSALVLYQNYPNPFYPSTNIDYEIPIPLHITLTVYTEDWQEVQTLVDKFVDAGYYRVNFYSDNISSGIYYYVLKSGKTILIGKMTCLK
jgi:hypothetical protein